MTIYDHDHKFNANGIQSDFNYGSVIIDNGCWIAANVTILRNTHIGEGCVIGAGTVVKGEIPPHSLVTNDRGIEYCSYQESIENPKRCVGGYRCQEKRS